MKCQAPLPSVHNPRRTRCSSTQSLAMIARTLGDASPETETRARRSAAFWLPPAPGTRGVGVGFTLKDPGSKCPLGPATSQMELTTKSTMVPMVTARAHVVRPGKPCKPRTARLPSGHYERQSSTAAFTLVLVLVLPHQTHDARPCGKTTTACTNIRVNAAVNDCLSS